MIFDDTNDMEQKAKDALADGKKDAKDAWADTKAAAEKAGNKINSEIEKM